MSLPDTAMRTSSSLSSSPLAVSDFLSYLGDRAGHLQDCSLEAPLGPVPSLSLSQSPGLGQDVWTQEPREDRGRTGGGWLLVLSSGLELGKGQRAVFSTLCPWGLHSAMSLGGVAMELQVLSGLGAPKQPLQGPGGQASWPEAAGETELRGGKTAGQSVSCHLAECLGEGRGSMDPVTPRGHTPGGLEEEQARPQGKSGKHSRRRVCRQYQGLGSMRTTRRLEDRQKGEGVPELSQSNFQSSRWMPDCKTLQSGLQQARHHEVHLGQAGKGR